MEAKPFAVVIAVVAAVAGSMGARSLIDWARREPGVSASVLTQAWSEVAPGGRDLVFESPLVPKPQNLDLPAEVRAQTREVAAAGAEGQGLNLMTMYMALPEGRTGSLKGAADGALSNIRAMPRTSIAASRQTDTTVAGLPAIDIEATVQREKQDDLKLHAVVVARGAEMWQVLMMHRQDQPKGDEAWQRVRGSMRLKPGK
jgi:hypothetical protein